MITEVYAAISVLEQWYSIRNRSCLDLNEGVRGLCKLTTWAS